LLHNAKAQWEKRKRIFTNEREITLQRIRKHLEHEKKIGCKYIADKRILRKNNDRYRELRYILGIYENGV